MLSDIVCWLICAKVITQTYETPKQATTTIATQGELHQEYAKSSIIPQTAILKRIYQLESSGGKNDRCRQQGKWNGYGFGQSAFSWNCYQSLQEVENHVSRWFEENLKTKTLSQALCYYNTGYVHDWCPYYEKYLS